MLSTLRQEYRGTPQDSRPNNEYVLDYADRLKRQGQAQLAMLALLPIATDECPKAQYKIGCLLADDTSSPENQEKGKDFLRKAEKNGIREASEKLLHVYARSPDDN